MVRNEIQMTYEAQIVVVQWKTANVVPESNFDDNPSIFPRDGGVADRIQIQIRGGMTGRLRSRANAILLCFWIPITTASSAKLLDAASLLSVHRLGLISEIKKWALIAIF